jgi:ParB family transcriptional regulator, chromosome partitioning protein
MVSATSAIDQLRSLTSRLNLEKVVRALPVDNVKPDPNQPRKTWGGEEDGQLVESVRANGILQPLLVRAGSHPEEFQIIFGERRWRAAQAAGLQEVPCIVREEIDPVTLLVVQLIENNDRAALSAWETATALGQLVESHALTRTEIATRLGRPLSWVSQHLAMLKSSPETQSAVQEDLIRDRETARIVEKLPPEQRRDLIDEARSTRKPISRGTASRRVAAAPTPSSPTPARRMGRPAKAPHAELTLVLTAAQVCRLFERLGLDPPDLTNAEEVQRTLIAVLS